MSAVLLRACCRLQFFNHTPVPIVLMLRPSSGEAQWVKAELYDVVPQARMVEFTDIYGNLCQRLTAPAGEVLVFASADVDVPDWLDSAPGLPATPIELLPDGLLHYLLPSRYCESDKMLTQSEAIVEGYQAGYDQAEAVRAWVQAHVAYAPGTTNTSASALDIWFGRQGVCRDQAHLGIALCRALGLPSRMGVGYLFGLEPMDLHAWFECYIGQRWWTFDAKEPTTKGGRIVLGYGRDAADVALATQFGASELRSLEVTVDLLQG